MYGCFCIPHLNTRHFYPKKYLNIGYTMTIELDAPICDHDGLLAAMGVASYTDTDGILYLTVYGIDLMQQGVKWLNDETDARIRKYYSIK